MFNRKLTHWVLPLIIFTLFWAGVLIYTGTLNSGFHFVDDHEMVRISDDLSRGNFFQVSADWIIRDFGLRFRPVYYFHRVLSVQLLGTNFLALSIQNLVLAIATSWLLYLVAKNLKLRSVYAYVFVFAGLVGTQAAIWWRLGPNETIGIFLFSIGLYALTKSYIVKSRQLYKSLSLIFVILASLCKESFIMMIPLVLFLNFLLFHNHSELNKSLSLWQAIRVNKWFNFILSTVFIVEGIFVVFVVGANKIGYAGGDSNSLNPKRLLSVFYSLVTESNWQLLLLSILLYFVGLGIYYYINKQWPVKQMQLLTVVLVGFIIAVVPQLVLYAKSGIYERYLIPATLAFSFLIAFLVSQLEKLISGIRIRNILLCAILICGILVVYPRFKTMLVFAQEFAAEGRRINAALSDMRDNSTPSDTIIVVAEPVQNFEEGYSLKNYLAIEQHKSSLYFQTISLSEGDSKFEQGLKDGFISFLNATEISNLTDKASAKQVFVFGNVEQEFLASQDWFEASNYHRNSFARYIVYTKLDK